jgi:ribonuclease BN (tRNA processing enzyme)
MTRLFFEMNEYDIDTRIKDEGRPPLVPLVHAHEVSGPGVVMQDERVKVMATPVHHPPVVPALAYRFDGPDRSIVFSGDTDKSDALVQLARGADVLVHEAMYLSVVDRLAATTLKAHLIASHTVAEDVGRVAAAAGVKTLVLSHLVPASYPVTDQMWMEAVRPHFAGEIVVARDLMEI